MSTISGLPTPPAIRFQTWPWLGLMKTPSPSDAGDRRPGGCRCRGVGVRIEGTAAAGSRTTSVAWPASINCQVLPVSTLRQMPPLRAAQGGVDDHLAGRRQLGIDDDLERRRCRRIRGRGCGESIGSRLPLRIDVVGAVERFQVAPPSIEIRKPTPGVPVSPSPVAAKMIDWLGSLFAAEDRDAADVDAGGRAEVGQRDVGRAAGVGRQEVGRLPDAAAGAADVDRVARGVGRVDRQAADAGRTAPVIDAGPTAVHCLARQRVGLAQREDAEAGADVVAARLAQARGRQRLLEAQRPAVETYRRSRCPTSRSDDQRPGPLGIQARERGERHLRVERGEERRVTVLDRSGRVVIEDRYW